MQKTHTNIERSLSNKKAGELIFPTDFRGKGTEAAIRKSLSRLVTKGYLKRISHGIYYIPKADPLFGELLPAPQQVAEAIARKEKVLIRPSGAYALNQLGLSTQVPAKLVYLTDGAPRRLKIGKAIIQFKATTHKKLSAKGKLSSLVILALEELNLKLMDKDREMKIRELLLRENPLNLQHDLRIAPARIHDYIMKLLK